MPAGSVPHIVTNRSGITMVIGAVVRWTLRILAAAAVLLVVIIVLLMIPAVQRTAVQRALSVVTDRTDRRIEIGAVAFGIAHTLQLHDLFVEDRDRDTLLSIGTLAVDVDLLSLFTGTIQIREISLHSVTARIVRTLPDSGDNFSFLLNAFAGDPLIVPEVPDTAVSPSPKIHIGSVQIERFRGSYHDEVSGTDIAVQLGRVFCSSITPDAAANRYSAGTLTILNSAVSITVSGVTDSVPDPPDTAAAPWSVSLAQLQVEHLAAAYDVRGAVRKEGLDLQHLRIDSMNLAAAMIEAGPERIAAVITVGSFREQGGLVLRKLTGRFLFDTVHTSLSGALIETAGSRIEPALFLTYPSLDDLSFFTDAVNGRLELNSERIAVADLLYFLPSLPLKDSLIRSYALHTAVTGNAEELQIERFVFTAGSSTTAAVSGRIRHLLKGENARYDITLYSLTTGRKDAAMLVSDSLLPATLTVPDSIHISGTFAGTLHDAAAALSLRSSIGHAAAQLQWAPDNGERWNAVLTTDAFNVGALLGDTLLLGPVSLTAHAAGSGWLSGTYSGSADVRVTGAVLNGYRYQGITVHASGGPKAFTGAVRLLDPSLDLSLEGTADLTSDEPAVTFRLAVEGADLQAMMLTEEDLRVAGTVTASVRGRTLNSMAGSIAARDLLIMKGTEQFRIDSITASSVRNGTETALRFDSPFLAAQFDGTIAPAELPAAFTQHLAYYIGMPDPVHGSAEQAFRFRLELRDPALLRSILLPDLHRFDAGAVTGSFNSVRHELNVSFLLAKAAYGEMSIDTLSLVIASDERSMDASLSVRAAADSTFRITNLLFTGSARDDSLHLHVSSHGDDSTVRFALGVVAAHSTGGYAIHIEDGSVILDSAVWSIPRDNRLQIGRTVTEAHHLQLTNGERSLSIITDPETKKTTVRIVQLELASLSRIAERRPGYLSGSVNGTLALFPPSAPQRAQTDLTIDDLVFMQHAVGNAAIRLDIRKDGQYAVRAEITGNGNQIVLAGTYAAAPVKEPFDLTGTFTRVNLAALEPFTFGAVQKLSGSMTGQIRLTGSADHPKITGSMTFADAGFTPAMLGTQLRLGAGTIDISGGTIGFRGFRFTDAEGGTASVNGQVMTEDFRSFRYDVTVKSRRFLLMNSRPKKDGLISGMLYVSSDGSLRGNDGHHLLTLQAAVEQGTDLALVLPSSRSSVEERKGIVRFTAPPLPKHPILAGTAVTGEEKHRSARSASVDISSNIRVTKGARLSILIDPVAGDSLVVQGDASFSVTVDPGGKLSLTGRYEIAEGIYQLSFGDFIGRTFTIVKGSSLTWLGSPLDAEIDITAVYTVKTSVLDLIQSQLSGMSNEERTKYKQKLPFQVFLNMKGKLRTPVIRFRLDLPPEQRGVLNGTVLAKLNDVNGQESELNKQVFALLVLGRFVRENPAASSDGGGVSDLARTSVSQLLSAQLNTLSERYIAGATLDVGLDSYKDYSSGTAEGRTQLQLALSKQLFNERVTVQVGGNVDLEGERNQKNSLNSLAGDLTVQYKLTEDGRWQLQVFRQNSYEGALDGDITKTGAGVAFSIDFNKLFGITLTPDTEEEEDEQ